jgi:hypothetical protein
LGIREKKRENRRYFWDLSHVNFLLITPWEEISGRERDFLGWRL